MVHFSAVLSVFALYLSTAAARPLPEDSAIGNEVGVSAPNGIVMSDTDELNRNRMVSTDLYPQYTNADQPLPTTTWSPPPPLPTGDGQYQGSPSDDYSPTYSPPSEYSPTYTPPSEHPPTYTPPSEHSPTYTPPSEYTPTTSVYEPQPSSTYGSGSNPWGGSSYDDCVKQCQAKYPALTPPTETPPAGTPTGTGKTHVVWVAPTQGVLRYVPFAVNASVGDTVKFIWGANNHTVTKGSQLTPCNKTSDSPFASGIQVKDFTFEQVVNDTNPVFFYCAVPNHCTKGMFGIINPPNAIAGPSSVGSMMQSMAAANPNLDKMRTYADNATKDSDAASKWGTNLDLTNIPQWAQESFVENVLYTRTWLAANPDVFKDGDIDVSLGGNPPVVPQDITQVALDNSPDYGYGSGSGNPPADPTTSTLAPSPTGPSGSANLSDNGAVSARSGITVVLAAIAAGFFLL